MAHWSKQVRILSETSSSWILLPQEALPGHLLYLQLASQPPAIHLWNIVAHWLQSSGFIYIQQLETEYILIVMHTKYSFKTI